METMEIKEQLSDSLLTNLNGLVEDIKVTKKDGTRENYNVDKIKAAVNKAAERASVSISEEEMKEICVNVYCAVLSKKVEEVTVQEMHNLVETALEKFNKEVAESYRNYRNYKQDFVRMLDKVYKESQRIMYLGDKSNANADSSLVTTKRSLMFNELSTQLYKKFFLNKEELQAVKEGYIYCHDIGSRLLTTNCCIANVGDILKGGFEMSNIWYNEPKTLEVAFGVIADVVLSASGAQYGGYTIGEVDKLLEPYAEMSYKKHYEEATSLGVPEEVAEKHAWKKLVREAEQGAQQWEYKYNTLSSARGDFSFISVTFGLGKSPICKMISKAFMNVRAKGQGRKGFEKPVLFPKLIFLYDEKLHGEGKELEDVFNCAVECSKIAMYPDYYSLSGDNYAGQMYEKYGTPISVMGCFKGHHSLGMTFNGVPVAQSIKRTWDELVKTENVKEQPAGPEHKYIDVSHKDIKVWDTVKQCYVKVNTFIRNVQNEWVVVKLSNGRFLEVTSDHPFETENRGVVLAKDITLNDEIRINYGAPRMQETISIPVSKAWLYGVMLCDGCYQNYSLFVSLGADELDIIDTFVTSFKYNYGVTPEVKLQERGKKGTYYDVRVRANEIAPVRTLIKEFESKFEGVQKIFRHIPKEVWSYTRECKLGFLAGMFDADGYIKKGKGLASLGSTNQELAYEQMYLIQSLGMPCKIRRNWYKGKQNSDKVRVVVDFYPTEEFIEYLSSQKKISNFIPGMKYKDTPSIVKVTELSSYEGTDYSYDISTESEHFEVNGVYSHNCRSALSPWYERGGMHPADDNDTPIFVGRGNMGVISLNLPMIYAKAKHECKDFYEILDYYLELTRKLHIKTVQYLGNMKASCNPLMYTQGGFLGGNLAPDDNIAPVLKSFTTSFGITALNELQRLYNGKSIAEDGEFALDVMNYINKFVDRAKEEDGILHSIYMTPAESLCGTQLRQFKEKYGIIENVSDKEYFTNGFHCHVSEDITPIEKQDLEGRFMDQAKGGQIYFNRFNCNYNTNAFKALIRRAMKKGFYFGTNFAKSFCENCGHEELDMSTCPKCGSDHVTQINRVCGYLGYSLVNGDTRFNKAKLAEVKDRKSY